MHTLHLIMNCILLYRNFKEILILNEIARAYQSETASLFYVPRIFYLDRFFAADLLNFFFARETPFTSLPFFLSYHLAVPSLFAP